MTDAGVWLRQPAQDEFDDEWLPRSKDEYARYIEESGAMPAALARDKVARSLYEALGYEVTSQPMRKAL